MRQGRNGGGQLNSGGNEGNVFKAGRKPNEVRAAYLKGAEKAAGYIQSVAAGLKVINSTDRFGKAKKRYPTWAEQSTAIDLCCKYGLGSKMDVTSDDQPLKAYINVDDSKM